MSAPSTDVGPGFLAFVAFFFLAVALWLLMRSMFKRMRRMNLAQRADEERSARQGRVTRGHQAPQGAPASGVGDGPEEGQGRGDEV